MTYLKALLSSKVNIFLIIFIILMLIFIFNFKIIFGMGDSMLPTLEGMHIYLCKYQKEYEVGDIVLYEIDNLPVVHRIIEKNVLEGNFENIEVYYTKGDNNEFYDPLPLTNTNIKCRIVTF